MNDLNYYIDKFQAILQSAGWCWSVGSSRLGQHECRIFLKRQVKGVPVFFDYGDSLVEAAQKAWDRWLVWKTKNSDKIFK